MITSTIYYQENFLKVRYDLFYLSDLKRTWRTFDGNALEIKNIVVNPSIEIFWMKNISIDGLKILIICFKWEQICLFLIIKK